MSLAFAQRYLDDNACVARHLAVRRHVLSRIRISPSSLLCGLVTQGAIALPSNLGLPFNVGLRCCMESGAPSSRRGDVSTTTRAPVPLVTVPWLSAPPPLLRLRLPRRWRRMYMASARASRPIPAKRGALPSVRPWAASGLVPVSLPRPVGTPIAHQFRSGREGLQAGRGWHIAHQFQSGREGLQAGRGWYISLVTNSPATCSLA